MNESVFDPKHILDSVGDDVELATELLQAYIEDAPQRMERLRASLESGDSEEAVRAAHSLKGMSGVVRSEILANMALKMEMTARAGDMDGVAQGYPALEQALETGLQQMRDYMDEVG